jgi:hypothetical protein
MTLPCGLPLAEALPDCGISFVINCAAKNVVAIATKSPRKPGFGSNYRKIVFLQPPGSSDPGFSFLSSGRTDYSTRFDICFIAWLIV